MPSEWVYEDERASWLLGLRWLPVLGQLTTAQAHQLAKKNKAKQWVMAGHTFMAVGMGFKRWRKPRKLHAAAVAYALLHPKGAHAAVYFLQDSVYWLAASKEGTPMRHGDQIFTTERAGQQALVQLRESYPELCFSTQIRPFNEFLSLLTERGLEQAVLQRHRSRAWPLWGMGLIATILAYGWWFKPTLEAAPMPEPAIDPYLVYWQNQKIQPNGRAALAVLLAQWRQTPLAVAGWQLKEANCVAKVQSWTCSYRYIAMDELSSAVAFESNLPDFLQIQTMDLQTIQATQKIDFSAGTANWFSTERLRAELLTPLQQRRAAFNVLRFGELAPVLKQTASPFTPIYAQRLQLEGPLRSLSLLLELGDEVHWSTLSLQYKPNAQPSLTSSALMAQLQGVVYVRN